MLIHYQGMYNQYRLAHGCTSRDWQWKKSSFHACISRGGPRRNLCIYNSRLQRLVKSNHTNGPDQAICRQLNAPKRSSKEQGQLGMYEYSQGKKQLSQKRIPAGERVRVAISITITRRPDLALYATSREESIVYQLQLKTDKHMVRNTAGLPLNCKKKRTLPVRTNK